MFRYGNLMGYYRDNFIMIKKYGWSLDGIESMIPWEKFLYIDMINIEEENLRKQR